MKNKPNCFGDGSVLNIVHQAEACCDDCGFHSTCLKIAYNLLERKSIPIKAIISAKVALDFYITDHCSDDECVDLMLDLEDLEIWLKKQKSKKR